MITLLALLACKNDDAPTWQSTDVRIDAAGPRQVDSDAARMCATPSGRLYAVWHDDRDGADAIWFNRSPDGGRTWETEAVRVNDGAAAASFAALACDDERVVVAWEDHGDGEIGSANVYVDVSTDGGRSWGAADVLLDGDVWGWYEAFGLDVALNGADVYVGWADTSNGSYDVFVASSRDGGATFGAPVRIDGRDEGSAWSAWPDLVAAPEGRAYVAFEDIRNGTGDIYFSTTADGGATWSDDERLDGDEQGAGVSQRPRLAADDGEVWVVWTDDRNGARDVYAATSADHGATWAEVQRADLDAAGLSESLDPEVAVRDGVAHVVWADGRQAGWDVYYRRAEAGVFGATEVRLDGGSVVGHSLHPTLTAGEAGEVVVAWEDRRHDTGGVGHDDLYYDFSADGGLTWSEEDFRLSSSEDGASVAIGASIAVVEGEVAATWLDGRDGTLDVYFGRVALGEQAVTPSTFVPPAE
jgi:hypothetical protein